jgi:hypothetical protein
MPKKTPDFGFTIGADPEFNLLLQDNRVSAEEVFSSLLEGLPSRSMGFETPGGEFGWDGCNETGEIRPKYAKNPAELVDNIGKIFKAVSKQLSLFDLSTLSLHGSVGGHIHFSLPSNSTNNGKVNLIHKRLASFYLPLMSGDNKMNLNVRLKSGYGKLNDSRADSKNGIAVYEFRTPSAEWLTTPKIAMATMAFLGTVYNEIINHPRAFAKYNDLIFKTEKQGSALQELLLADYPALSKGIIEQIKKYIKKFEFYPMYKNEINYILNPERVLADKKAVSYNIMQGWKLQKPSNLPNAQKVLAKKIVPINKKLDIEELSGFVNFTINGDSNVETFAKELSKRIVAFNWKLNHQYFFFGLRKGIKSLMAVDANLHFLAGQERLKTQDDLESMKEILIKMQSRYRSAFKNYNNMINLRTGELAKDTQIPIVMIGIPYEDRQELNFKPFLKLVHSIEKGLKPVEISHKNLPEYIEIDGKRTPGEITEVLHQKELNLHIDKDSNPARRAAEATRQVAQEMDQARIESGERILGENPFGPGEAMYEADYSDAEETLRIIHSENQLSDNNVQF